MMLGIPAGTWVVGHRQGILSLSKAEIRHVHPEDRTVSRHCRARWPSVDVLTSKRRLWRLSIMTMPEIQPTTGAGGDGLETPHRPENHPIGHSDAHRRTGSSLISKVREDIMKKTGYGEVEKELSAAT